ncbi:MAG: response regulator transcription factor [Salibacteraceae bacterium]
MEAANYKVLIIDNDPGDRSRIESALSAEGYRVYAAGTAQEGIHTANAELPHLVFTELVLDDMDGVGVCVELRENRMLNQTGIAVLSHRQENYSQIAALNAGADDYLVKPVNTRLFLSKVRAMLRRLDTLDALPGNAIAGLRIDREKFLVVRNNREIFLPRKEFEILSLLVSKPKKVFSREEIKDEVWGFSENVRSRTIDVHIRKLREKVGERLIKTVKGVGYKLEA